MSLAIEITKEHIAQLKQLCSGPVWDGNLINKSSRDWLFNKNCVHRHEGWNFLAVEGIKMSLTFSLIKK